MLINYIGLLLGYLNKVILFVWILKPDEIGLINLILSVGMLFAQFSNLGTINTIVKFLPFFKDERDQKQGFIMLNILFVLGGVLLFSAIAVFMQDSIIHAYSEKSILFVNYYFWIIPIGISNVFFLVLESYLKALYKNILAVFAYEFILRIIITVLLLLLYFDYINFDQFLILHCLVYFVPSLILLIYLIRINELSFKKSTFKISKKFKKIIFSFSLFSYSNTLGTLLVTTMDALMIAYYLGLEATGVYTTVIYLSGALQIPYKSLIRVSSPLVPQYWKEKDMSKMQDLYKKVSSISIIIALYMFLLVWGSRYELFGLLPDDKFQPGIWVSEGITVFLLLMMGKLFDMYFGLNGMIFITSKKYKYDIIFTVVLIFLVFLLNSLLIPIYGMSGAAFSTGFAFLIYNVGRLLFVYFTYKIHPFHLNQLKIIILSVVVLLGMEYLPVIFSNPFVEILLNSALITIFFVGTIYVMKLEPEINSYVENGKKMLTKKIKS